MRQYSLLGLVILGLGAFLLLRGGSFTHRESVVNVGDVHVTASEKETIPPWVGGVVMIVGAAVLMSGLRKRA
jgi:hypothetical protein